MSSHTIALNLDGALTDDDKEQLAADIAAAVASTLCDLRGGDSGGVKATFVREEHSLLPDDPHAADVDRLLLAFWIQPEHAVQIGFDAVLAVVRAMRWDLHRLPMVAEDWGTERTLREELAKAIDTAVTELRGARIVAGAEPHVLIGFDDAPTQRALTALVEAQTWLADPEAVDEPEDVTTDLGDERRDVRIWIDVELVDGADPDLAAEHLFDLAASDPTDIAPEIDTVLTYGLES